MTKITKHYHGFEVNIEPVDGYELTEDDYLQIKSDTKHLKKKVFQKNNFLKRSSECNLISEWIFYEEILLAKIEAKRLPEKEDIATAPPITISLDLSIIERLDKCEESLSRHEAAFQDLIKASEHMAESIQKLIECIDVMKDVL